MSLIGLDPTGHKYFTKSYIFGVVEALPKYAVVVGKKKKKKKKRSPTSQRFPNRILYVDTKKQMGTPQYIVTIIIHSWKLKIGTIWGTVRGTHNSFAPATAASAYIARS